MRNSSDFSPIWAKTELTINKLTLVYLLRSTVSKYYNFAFSLSKKTSIVSLSLIFPVFKIPSLKKGENIFIITSKGEKGKRIYSLTTFFYISSQCRRLRPHGFLQFLKRKSIFKSLSLYTYLPLSSAFQLSFFSHSSKKWQGLVHWIISFLLDDRQKHRRGISMSTPLVSESQKLYQAIDYLTATDVKTHQHKWMKDQQ